MASDKLVNIENYHDLFNHVPVGIYTSTIEGKYIEVNDALVEILGYRSKSELIEIADIGVDIFAMAEKRKSLINRLLSREEVITTQITLKKKDNTQILANISAKIIVDENKQQLVVGMIENITEQIKTENAILSEKQTLFTLIEKIPDYIYLKNKEGQILIANNSVRKALEASSSQKKAPQGSISQKLFENDDELLKSGEVYSEQLVEIESNTGTLDFISLSKHPIYNNKNEITGLIGIGRNLTDLKQAERQIIKSQANLSALIESSNDLIWSVDKNINIVTFNSSFSDFVERYTNNKLTVGSNAINLFNGSDSKFWESCYLRTQKGEKLHEEICLRFEGKNLFFECSFNPIFDSNHNTTGISVILTNITERRAAQDVIRESEERFRQLAENTNDAFVLWDSEGVLYANPSFESIYGIRIEDILSDISLVENAIDPEDHSRYLRNRKKETSGKHNTRNQQYRLRVNKRNVKKIWTRHYPVYNYKGKIYRYVTVTSDITAQKNLEEVLTATRSQQQALLDNIPFFAWLKDKNGRYISVNHPLSDFYKLKPEEIIGKTDFDLLPREIAKKNTQIDNEVIKSGERRHFEDFRKTAYGEEWVEIYKSPIFNEDGKVIGLTGISREITDRKRLEEAIKRNEEHFRALLQYSSDSITILDIEGVIVFESSLRNRILNFTVEELVGKPFTDIVHPEDIGVFNIALKESISNPEIQIKREYRSLHKNKKWIYVESIFTNHLNNPSINGIVVNTRDISDRKMAEFKEKAYHNNLIFLSNSALELLSLADKENIYKYISIKLREFLGDAILLVSAYNEDDKEFEVKQLIGPDQLHQQLTNPLSSNPVGLKYSKYIKPEQIENAGSIVTLSNVFEIFEKDSSVYSNLSTYLGKVSTNKIYNITLARHNKLLGSILIVTLNKNIIRFKHIIETFAHQISVALHRSHLEQELITAKTKAEESDRLKTAFLANMSHEIRTPMNGILGFAEMLNDTNLPEDARKKYLNIINNNGKVLISLIDDIIDFAKIEAGQVKIIKHDFSLNVLLSQIYSSLLTDKLKREKPEVKLRLRKALNDEESFINTDPNRLRQIITNLVGNAFKFTNSGYIEIGYELEDGKLLFHVSDTGIGIADDKLNAIFDRFVQADNSRSRKYSGSGLGLAISKGFVELLEGEMWAKSEISKGSTFYFSLPYKQAQTKKVEKSPERKPKSIYNWSNKKFLIAEDDFFSYKFLEGFLKQTKAEIVHADDGQKAVDICKEQDDIDVILMDVQMPEMNGIDATKNIKKFRDTPIIAQTANAIAEEKQKCFEAGFDDFVTKPINISELFMKIDHWLAKTSK